LSGELGIPAELADKTTPMSCDTLCTPCLLESARMLCLISSADGEWLCRHCRSFCCVARA
jgi:hypothetical protein